jgi:RNA polymerase sigma-70 factor (ECF subfamily)
VTDDLLRRETVDTVRRAVLSLPANYREVVVLCDLQEMTYEQAAGLLECAVGTVRSRLHRGRALLAAKLRPRLQAAVAVRCLA